MSQQTQPSLELGVVGNCQIGALIDERGRVVWACFPRFDADPLFCSLLGGSEEPDAGFLDVQLDGQATSRQRYETNTAVLVTTLHDRNGSEIDVVDFAPRFTLYGRAYHPAMLIRRLIPRSGRPLVRIRCRPLMDYGRGTPTSTFGSNHVRYVTPDFTLRMTTDASLASVLEERPFVLSRPITMILGPDETPGQSPQEIGSRFHEQTVNYWQEWTRGLTIPFEWQEAVIRAAITLKLCTYHDTGAVLAALTTSIPEAPNSQRNWDYRYCWLRDSYFVVRAMNRLGTTKTMEAFLRYVIDLASQGAVGPLQPLYSITGRSELTESTVDRLPGYRDMGPVRIGNDAFRQHQHDVYGAVILSAMQYFLDRRLPNLGDLVEFRRLETLGELAVQYFDKPDAGLWEFRNRSSVHTFSAVMCWAACDRLGRLAEHLEQTDRAHYWRSHADAMRGTIEERGWSPELQSFVATFDGEELDASLLLLHELDFLDGDDPRFVSTVEAIERALRRGPYMFRYSAPDDFGAPETAFNVCTFWFIEALHAIGREAEARELFEHMLASRTALGLLSEDIDPRTHEHWGNFPQTYSLVGIVHAAMRLSKSWDEAL